uniref:Fanconi anemia complementation group G n=1 Tax=Cynoglossus semilaevis TaxID=244447 RepID=A0A3P8W0K9_CYNSE
MYRPTSLLYKWIQENNALVQKLKRVESSHSLSRDQNQNHLRWCSLEFDKLLSKVQGVPPLADDTHLELSVAYNTCLCFTAQSRFTDSVLILSQSIQRVLQTTDEAPQSVASDLPAFWKKVLKSVRNTTLNNFVLNLLCSQWLIWLATCKLKAVQEFEEDLYSLTKTLCAGAENDMGCKKVEKFLYTPLLVMEPRRLAELLQIWTSVAQGAERLAEGQNLEALSGLQKASSLPAPRILLAYIHHLCGCCFVQMNCPQMALQCYKKALETDYSCVCALYQSVLIYRQLGNTQAEIQALCLLYSTLMLPPPVVPPLADAQLLSPSLLLHSQSFDTLHFVPSALSVLHTLALKCVLHNRLAEGVDHYLDLLATLQSEDQQPRSPQQINSKVPDYPRLPELYLEAGAALLMACRPADCMALCNEVINTTLELLPQRLVLEDPEKRSHGEDNDDNGEDKAAVLFWTGTAYLLQGHCYSQLKDWKQAVTHYTRCINLLVKVCVKTKGSQPQVPGPGVVVKPGTHVCVLQRLKGLSLVGRGVSFTLTDHLQEALRDLQLSLHAFPECVVAGLWCGEVLWKLGRRREAAACWEKTWSYSTQSTVDDLPLYLQEPQLGSLLDSTEIRKRIQELGPTRST